MTTVDRSGASEAEFRARIAPFEAGDAEQERVARAMEHASATRPRDLPAWSPAWWDHLAAAAIAALRPSEAEQAVKPTVCACGHPLSSHDGPLNSRGDLCRGGMPGFCGCPVYRAALASPAPDVQDGER